MLSRCERAGVAPPSAIRNCPRRPHGRTRGLLAWTVACCLAAGACSGPSRSAPPPRAEEAPSTLMPMDPEFSSALSSYASEVQRLEHLVGAIETSEIDDHIRRALRLLTVAVERIPRPEADDEVISLAVAQMHAAEVEGALLALPSDGVVIDPAERVLNAASTAFIHLARGPYL